MSAAPDVRPSLIAGTWYSGDPKRLASQVDSYLENVMLPPLHGPVVGLVAPHAGLRFSGKTAGFAFAAVVGQYRPLVAVLSPLHDYHSASFLTTGHHAYWTPLGEVPVNQALLREIASDLSLSGGLVPLVHDREHSLEIELPFLQRALAGPFELVPIMVRTQDPRLLTRLSESLMRRLAGRDALLVASSDLSHFYPQKQAEILDREMLRRIEALDPVSVLQAQPEGKGYACGVGAVAALLQTARLLGADNVQIVHYSTSAVETGDHSSVVGYGAAIITRGAEG